MFVSGGDSPTGLADKLFDIAITRMVQSTLAPWVARGEVLDKDNGTA